MMHKIQCECGSLRGHIDGGGITSRVICYCSDCQAFAKYLGRPEKVLDAHGGTDIVQLAQPRLHISDGLEHLALLQLSSKGLFRWYASCCNTPIGNTLNNPKISFIGLVHSCLDKTWLATDFGQNVAKVNTESATGGPKAKTSGLLGNVLRFFGIALSMLITSKYKASELFSDDGAPIVSPTILTEEQLAQLKNQT
ncbi:DUF6151 family protein [Methylophaga sulfidovorans]|uniref:CENP-V/GFA domain-containing protein n=1 Tax=Methylophaga sulfidovorans TaxID=45496 RepID=A0A1I3XZE4_9GAMM|nr:DUF6151 family protein [Methylophaga sulfidovorans]SFK24589.1 hypothetical protein SAMN04488079_10741 [Methylophaga sulfidovorans]